MALDESALDLKFTHAFDIQINFDKRWLIGPVSGGANVGYTSVGAGCTVSGSGTGDASALTGTFEFVGACASIFQDVTFSITPGCQ